MAQYIDKDTLVAEIERRLNYRVESLKAINDGTFWDEDQSEDEFNKSLTRCAFNAAKNEVFELMCFLDTLEMKEVDLEKEIQMFSMNLAMKENNGDWEKDIAVTAKHFFELGLSVRIKAQKGE